MSTCRTLIKQVEDTVQNYVGIKITSIDVSIGQLANIDIQELQELFPLASKNTITENAKLNILSVAADINCLDCGKDSPSNNRELTCPLCHSKNTIPLNGMDMLLTNVELESEY